MKTKLLSIGVLLFAIVNSYGQVSLPYYEGFNYAAGTAIIETASNKGLGNWQMNGTGLATGAGNIGRIFTTPTWAMGGLPDPAGESLKMNGGNDDYLSIFTTQSANSVIYASFVFKIPTPTTNPTTNVTEADQWNNTNGDRFIAFGSDNPGAGPFESSCVFVRRIGTSSTYNLGIGETTTAASVIWDPTVFSYDQDVVIVMKYQIDPVTNPTGLSTLYINPTIPTTGSTEPTTNNGITTADITTAARPAIDRIRFQRASATNTPRIIFDELRVANTWQEVVGQPKLGITKSEIAGLNVYPNPVTNGKVFINSDNSVAKKVAVYDVLGKQLIQKEVSDGALDVSSLNKGVYLIKVSEGAATSTRKLIID